MYISPYYTIREISAYIRQLPRVCVHGLCFQLLSPSVGIQLGWGAFPRLGLLRLALEVKSTHSHFSPSLCMFFHCSHSNLDLALSLAHPLYHPENNWQYCPTYTCACAFYLNCWAECMSLTLERIDIEGCRGASKPKSRLLEILIWTTSINTA